MHIGASQQRQPVPEPHVVSNRGTSFAACRGLTPCGCPVEPRVVAGRPLGFRLLIRKGKAAAGLQANERLALVSGLRLPADGSTSRWRFVGKIYTL